MEQDYEALGRYYASLETFNELSSMRHRLSGELCRMLSHSMERNQEVLTLFDHESARMLLEEIIALNAHLIQVTEHLNRYAAECGKPEIRPFYRKG
ncbi:MAG: hypothetical protein PHT19_16275 [Methylococcus sp.]|nr:hypothetical protein [Methylococcus sp.]